MDGRRQQEGRALRGDARRHAQADGQRPGRGPDGAARPGGLELGQPRGRGRGDVQHGRGRAARLRPARRGHVGGQGARGEGRRPARAGLQAVHRDGQGPDGRVGAHGQRQVAHGAAVGRRQARQGVPPQPAAVPVELFGARLRAHGRQALQLYRHVPVRGDRDHQDCDDGDPRHRHGRGRLPTAGAHRERRRVAPGLAPGVAAQCALRELLPQAAAAGAHLHGALVAAAVRRRGAHDGPARARGRGAARGRRL